MTHPGPPVPKARARTANGHTFTPKRTRDAEEALRAQFHEELADGYVPDPTAFYSVEIRFFMPTFRRSDVDNLCKLPLDAANKIVWPDDMQVVELHAYVTRGCAEPRTEIVIATVANPHVGTLTLEGIAS